MKCTTVAGIGCLLALGCMPPARQKPTATPSPAATPSPFPLSAEVGAPTAVFSDGKGRRILEVRGGTATLIGGTATAELVGTAATLYELGKPAQSLQARRIRFDPKTRLLTADGNVEARTLDPNAPRMVRSDRLIWNPATGRVDGSGNVVATGEDGAEIGASRFTTNTRLEHLRLSSNEN